MARERVATQPDPPGTKCLQLSTRTHGLLDRVQREALRYYIEFAHPTSGMARERSGPPQDRNPPGHDETVTSGGTGFGIMSIIAGIERGWIG